ncbi:MAG: single-stranded DNA-binding protein [Actinomycetaceae bacterium]|nr:single-stranded DNA-binding protein [Actinomycetaceae bacterium]
MSATTTVQGRLGHNPEIRYTPSGSPVIEASLCATPRKRDRQTGKWSDDGAPLWIRATFWDETAEWLAETARQGDQIAATGNLALEAFTRTDGTPGTALLLRHARLLGIIPRRSNTPQAPQNRFSEPNRPQPSPRYPSGTNGPQNGSWSFGQAATDQPPF